MDIRKIKKLIELVEESGISELEISEGEESVRISRAAPAASFPVMQQAYAAPMMQQPAQSNAAAPGDRSFHGSASSSGNQWSHRTFPDGWYFLPHPKPGRESVHRSGSESQRGRYPVHR